MSALTLRSVQVATLLAAMATMVWSGWQTPHDAVVLLCGFIGGLLLAALTPGD